jgi:hypothetical protein
MVVFVLTICALLKEVNGLLMSLALLVISQLRIFTAQALVSTHKGDAIATFHHMALLGKGKRILLCMQMEAFGADINDRS